MIDSHMVSQAIPGIVAKQLPASTDVDRATVQTVEQMGEYVRQSLQDPLIQRVADYAWRKFGLCRLDARSKVWAVFWWVKHCVRFETDENTLMFMGRVGEQDLLIAPSVLLRMKRPAEDCDGFSMLVAAMLQSLGVPVGFAAVAVDPDERGRWSHVFVLAELEDDEVQAIDASHGAWPGWMVPLNHIFRWQAFDLFGKPLKVQPRGLRPGEPAIAASKFRGFHGYMRTGLGSIGLGDDDETFNIMSGDPLPSGGAALSLPGFDSGSSGSIGGSLASSSPLVTGSMGGSSPMGGSSSTVNSNSWITSLLNNSFGLATKTLAPTVQTTVVRDPVTGQIISSSSNVNGAVSSSVFGLPSTLAAAATSGGGTLMLLGVGLVAFVIIAGLGKKS